MTTYQNDKDEDLAFYSLSDEEQEEYFKEYNANGGNVKGALDSVLGSRWFDSDGDPKGSRNK